MLGSQCLLGYHAYSLETEDEKEGRSLERARHFRVEGIRKLEGEGSVAAQVAKI